MTTITLSIVAAAPPGENDPTAWTLGYIAGILRAQGVTVRSIVAAVPGIEQAVGLDIGPGARRALDTAAKLAAEIDATVVANTTADGHAPDDVQCEWCQRWFRPRGLAIHLGRSRCAPVSPAATTSAADAAPPRDELHAARRARAAEAM